MVWEVMRPEHQFALAVLLNCESSKELTLISIECGGRVVANSLLVALHSPLVAEMLLDAGLKTSISLPFPLSSISALVRVLEGEQAEEEKVGGLEELASCLGIAFKANSSYMVKTEAPSEDEEGDQGDLKETTQRTPSLQIKKVRVRLKRLKSKKYLESSSEESGDDDEALPASSSLIEMEEKEEDWEVIMTNLVVGQMERKEAADSDSDSDLCCPQCDYSCSHSYDLKKHMRAHTFNCTQCDYTCSKSYKLKRHAMMHARTSDQLSLTKHIKVQTSASENPYSCTICDYSCSQLGVLRRHIRKHTCFKQAIISKPFICEFCDFVCSHLKTLESHMKMHL